jgi:nucleoside-diphosphate-sugar epimerase
MQERGFTYVTDIINGQILACEKIGDGTAINLGSEKRYRINDVVGIILQIARYTPKVIYDQSKPEGPFSRALDISLARKLLGWEPKVDLPVGLANTLSWMESALTQKT